MKRILLPIISLLMTTFASALEIYELRNYQLQTAEAAQQFDAWMEASGMEEFKAAGAAKVGVFKPRDGGQGNPHARFVLLQFNSIGDLTGKWAERLKRAVLPQFSGVGDLQASDATAIPAGETLTYDRIESSLLTAFPGFPYLVEPEGSGTEERFFEMRVYESPNERLAALKVEMFCEGGEIAIFRECGLDPVFFGSARIAGNYPQLTYMVVHENQAAADAAWQAFQKSEKWQTLKALPRYAGTVSKIHKHFLVALPCSEIR